MLKNDISSMQEFLLTQFPQSKNLGIISKLTTNQAEMILVVNDSHLRPGGTISGPTMMALVDVTMYVAILNEIGPVALAVTTNLNINFLRKPKAGKAIIAKANILKLGKRLAIGEVSLYSQGDDAMVAHATLTYSIPK